MIAFFESVLNFFSTILGVLLQIFQSFWQMLQMIAKSVAWITAAILYLPSFVQGTILAVLGIMVCFLIINRGGSEN